MDTFPKSKINAISVHCFGKKPISIKQYWSENNFVYLLTFPNREAVLKVARMGEAHGLDKEIYLLKLLSDNDIPVPSIRFLDLKGEIVPNHWLIMDKIGNKNLNEQQHREDLYRRMGEVLAKVHKVKFSTQGYLTSKGVMGYTHLKHTTEVFNNRLNKLVEFKLITPIEVEKARKLFSTFKNSTEKRLCHGDFGPWQVLVKEGKIAGLIDWDFAKSSHSVFDFARTEMVMGFWSKNINHFRAGYESVKKLPKDYDTIKKPYQLVEVMNLMIYFKDRPVDFRKCRRKFLQLIS